MKQIKNSCPDRAPALAAALRTTCALAAAALMSPAFAAAPPAGQAKAASHATSTAKKAVAKAAAHASAGKKAVAVRHADSKHASGKHAGSPGHTASAKHAAGKAAAKTARKEPEPLQPGQLANFGKESAPDDVVKVANWVSVTHDSGKRGFVIIDKKQAQLYVFDPQGKLKSHTPVLVGKAVGDRALPGSGDKPLSKLRDDEKTTPAGRFLAMRGKNTLGADVLWIDYKQAIAMHRLASVSAAERRAERLASPDPGDNHISNGCVNVPPRFYDSVLKPTITKIGAIIYVLPETMPPQQVFGSLDIHRPAMAQANTPATATRKAG